MDFYGISLLTGATGIVVMAVGGLSHGGGHAGHGGHAHGGHAGHAGHAAPAGHAGPSAQGHVAAASHGAAGHHAGMQNPFYQLLSPRVLFALLVGFGAGGLLAAPLGEPFRAGAAILAAAGFEALLVGPLWRFLFRFESSPAATLESAIDDEARAVTGFDAKGQGLVAVEVDGQIIQLLATLEGEALQRGVHVRSGDVVRVAAVDAARGRCTVRENDR
ncbi:MAG: hypothetical protein JWN53_1060 [Gemmatimonadetes bacterium]|nr:hypothetical protein [Gemmatimonadota bacterium]